MKIEIIYQKNKSLLSAIIFLIMGAILLSNADKVLSIISIGFGSILLAGGIIKTLIYAKKQKSETPSSKIELIGAVALILLGIIFVFFSDIIETSIRFIFGAWIFASGINQLISALSLSRNNSRFLSSLIIAIILIILGLYVIFTEDLFLKSIGIVMIIYASIEIISFIFAKKDIKEVEPKEGETTLIIPDKKHKKR